MKKMYAMLMAGLLAFPAMAQVPVPTIKRMTVVPVLDGTVDAIWNAIPAIAMEQMDATPDVAHANWRMGWNDTAIFVMLDVDDDNFCPPMCSGLADWQSDRAEMFFNVSGNLTPPAGVGADPGLAGPDSGFYQFTSPFNTDAGATVNQVTAATGSQWPANARFHFGYAVDGTRVIYEWAIPLSQLTLGPQVGGTPLAIANNDTIGFDIYWVDLDEGEPERQMMKWWSAASDGWADIGSIGRIRFSTDTVAFGAPPVSAGRLAASAQVLTVFPNPASEAISLNLQAAADVQILDITGRVVISRRVTPGETISVSELSRGIYFVRANGVSARFVRK